MLTRLLLAAALLCCGQAFASGELLTPEQAFPMQAVRASNGDVLLVFNVAPGYALYKERLSVKSEMVARVEKPAGIVHNDEYLGPMELYRERAVIRVVPKKPWAPLELQLKSQGCADAGVCYNPVTRTLRIP